jgi:hypothetical protein
VKWPEPAEAYGVYQRRDILPEEPVEAPRARRSRRRDLTASA